MAVSTPASATVAKPAIGGNSYTTCGQSSGLQTRVCIDKSAGRGYIYTAAPWSTATSSFVIGLGAGFYCSPFTATAGDWTYFSTGITKIANATGYCSGNEFLTLENASGGGNTVTVFNPYHDQLELYSAAPGWEFVLSA